MRFNQAQFAATVAQAKAKAANLKIATRPKI